MGKPERPSNATALIIRARAGDAGARTVLLEYGAAYLRWKATHPKLRSPTRPSDVGGDAVLKLVQSFADFEGNLIEQFEAWLLTIVTTRALGLVRRGKRQNKKVNIVVSTDDPAASEVPEDQKSPSASMIADEDWHVLYTAIGKLPKDQGRAVHLKHIDELPVAEVAQRMKKTPIKVAGLIQRGVEGVRKQLLGKTNSAPRKTTRKARDATIIALLEYMQKLDAGQEIDVDSFVSQHPMASDSLRDLIEGARSIREVGGKFAGKDKFAK